MDKSLRNQFRDPDLPAAGWKLSFQWMIGFHPGHRTLRSLRRKVPGGPVAQGLTREGIRGPLGDPRSW